LPAQDSDVGRTEDFAGVEGEEDVVQKARGPVAGSLVVEIHLGNKKFSL
jgi:hypothetical protein